VLSASSANAQTSHISDIEAWSDAILKARHACAARSAQRGVCCSALSAVARVLPTCRYFIAHRSAQRRRDREDIRERQHRLFLPSPAGYADSLAFAQACSRPKDPRSTTSKIATRRAEAKRAIESTVALLFMFDIIFDATRNAMSMRKIKMHCLVATPSGARTIRAGIRDRRKDGARAMRSARSRRCCDATIIFRYSPRFRRRTRDGQKHANARRREVRVARRRP